MTTPHPCRKVGQVRNRLPIGERYMAKHWNTCWICGKNWSSTSPSNDCGSNDAQHREARGQ